MNDSLNRRMILVVNFAVGGITLLVKESENE
jgi:hypothetical protein